ncbi:MAG TPA: hypothetical protein PKH03_09465 [Syntrophales bacterium]|nr:hypothetical protein [Syntrophales bacterium]
MIPRLLSDLNLIGYEISMEGDNIRLRYRKPGNPPETARQLIAELQRFKSEAIQILKTRTNIPPPLVENTPRVIWINPYSSGTPEARRESLLQCMEATWLITFDRIMKIWPQGFISTPEIRAAEIGVEIIQADVLTGRAKLADFQEAVEVWERVVTRQLGLQTN